MSPKVTGNFTLNLARTMTSHKSFRQRNQLRTSYYILSFISVRVLDVSTTVPPYPLKQYSLLLNLGDARILLHPRVIPPFSRTQISDISAFIIVWH